jgi:hypothetical protein
MQPRDSGTSLRTSTPRDARDKAAVRRFTTRDIPAFVRVEGDGVHEIPWARSTPGIIEPGISASRSWARRCCASSSAWATRTRDRPRFEDFTVAEGYRLAGRVSGDSTVAYAWAYAQAAESAAGDLAAGARALAARAAARARAHRQPPGRPGRARQRRRLRLRALAVHAPEGGLAARRRRGFGHRFAMDAIVPGGVAVDPPPTSSPRMARHAHEIELEARALGGYSTSTPGCRTASSPPGA